ncbi:MAG TPA: hypothetical protein VG733_19470 [Chthoniobacteraceae bacterium]|nr:hypothetical protein [Chthoniobacteraceae bacterium]
MRLFPWEDRYWTQTLETARVAIGAGETVCAHGYFLEFFPQALPYLALAPGALEEIDWIIFHKDALRHTQPGVMRRVKEEFAAAFANEVFVLFAGKRVAGRGGQLQFDPMHVGALWVMLADFEKRAAQGPGGGEWILDAVRRLRADRSPWPPDVAPAADAGIVISASGRFFKELYANLRNIRARGCALPVDVWHLPGEFTRGQIAALSQMAGLVDAGKTPFNDLSGRHEVHGFKAWMLAHSRFRRTLMLDANCFPLTDLAAVFASGEECILWPDGPWPWCWETCWQLRRALGIPAYDTEFESGQLFVDKASPRVREALRLAAALNTLTRRLYDYTHGDKETYSIACDLLGVPFRLAPPPAISPPGAAADDIDTVVTQRWLDGSPLFYHALGKKRQHWALYGPEWAALEKEATEAEAACAKAEAVCA